MSRNKQKKFKEFASFNNTFDSDKQDSLYHFSKLLQSNRPLILEVGCGKGAYTLALAKKHPEKLIIGVDYQGERLWAGAKEAKEQNLSNAYFLRARVEQLLELFKADSVTTIWITFPDPFPKDKHAKRRLTSHKFLDDYKKLLVAEGKANLKTDSDLLYQYSIDQVSNYPHAVIIENIFNVDILDTDHDALLTVTDYEQMHRKLGEPIHFLSWSYHLD